MSEEKYLEGHMKEERRFNRVTCLEKLAVGCNGNIIRAKLLDISLKGALVEFENDVTFQNGEMLDIALSLDNSDIVLQFGSKVMNRSDNVAGVKIINIDLDSMIHLRSFIEARTMDPEQVAKEFEYF
jgi:c-di-GMP-binding flagellar brake protein YcgR